MGTVTQTLFSLFFLINRTMQLLKTNSYNRRWSKAGSIATREGRDVSERRGGGERKV